MWQLARYKCFEFLSPDRVATVGITQQLDVLFAEECNNVRYEKFFPFYEQRSIIQIMDHSF